MKKALLICSLIFVSFSFFSQNKIERISALNDNNDALFFQKMLGEDSDSFYSLRLSNKGKGYTFFIKKYDKETLGLLNSFPIGNYLSEDVFFPNMLAKYPENHDKVIDNSFIKKTKLYLFSRQFTPDQKTINYVLDVFDLTNGDQIVKETVLSQLPCTVENYYNAGFHLCLNADSSKMGIVSRYALPKSTEDLNYTLYEVPTLKKIGNKKLPNRYKNFDTSSENFLIDNSGNLFYSFNYDINYKDHLVNGFGLAKYILSFDELMSFNLNVKANISIFNSNYKLDTKNGLVYFYAMFAEVDLMDKKNKVKNEGFYIAQIDEKMFSVKKENYLPFTSELIGKLTCNKTPLNVDYYPDMQLTDDGNFYIFTKQMAYSYLSEQPIAGSGSMVTGFTRYYADGREIIISRIDPSLTMNWMKMIPRNTSFITFGKAFNLEDISKMTIINKDNKLGFLFVEHPAFEEKKLDFQTMNTCDMLRIINYKEVNAVLYTIGKDGVVTKEVIYKNQENWLTPNADLINAGPKKYIVRFRKGKEEKYGRLNLN